MLKLYTRYTEVRIPHHRNVPGSDDYHHYYHVLCAMVVLITSPHHRLTSNPLYYLCRWVLPTHQSAFVAPPAPGSPTVSRSVSSVVMKYPIEIVSCRKSFDVSKYRIFDIPVGGWLYLANTHGQAYMYYCGAMYESIRIPFIKKSWIL